MKKLFKFLFSLLLGLFAVKNNMKLGAPGDSLYGALHRSIFHPHYEYIRMHNSQPYFYTKRRGKLKMSVLSHG